MPTTRPSDKGHDDAQWWKDETPEEQRGTIPPDQTATDKDNSARTIYDEEMEPLVHPSSG